MPPGAVGRMHGWLRDIGDFFFPRCCLVCGRVLLHDEEFLCCHCLLDLPRTDYGRVTDNPMEQLFYGKLQVERCAAYFFFTEGGDYRRLIHDIKYKGEKECGAYLGALFARENVATGLFDSVDYLVPVPLHPRKWRKRGYNQSEWICSQFQQTFSRSSRGSYSKNFPYNEIIWCKNAIRTKSVKSEGKKKSKSEE